MTRLGLPFSLNFFQMNFLKAFSSFVLASLVLLVVACKKEGATPDGALAYVPATSTSVTAIDLKKMMQKADFESVKQMDFYKKMVSEAERDNPQFAKVLLDPAASGVDLDSKIYTSTSFNEQNPEWTTTYLFVPLKDAAAFEQFMKSSKQELIEKEGVKSMDSGGTTFMGWNKSLAVFAISTEPIEQSENRVANAFKIDTENTLTKDARLQKALAANHDVTSWMSTNSLAKNGGAGMFLSLINVKPDALKDNFISGYADFENGKMVGHSDFDINKKLGDEFIGRFFKKEAEADFSKILPKEKMTFATVLSLDLVGIDKFLSERPDSKKYADFALNDLGFKRADLIEALGGDVMVAGFGSKDLQNAKLMISMSLKNEAKARELLQMAVEQKKLREIEKDLYTPISIGNEMFSIQVNKGFGKILLKNGMLTFCSDDELMNKIKAGETGGEYASAIKAFDNQTFAGWFDFDALSDYLGNKGVDGAYKEMNFKVNGKGADFIIETKDPNKNSLKALFEMINEAYLSSENGQQEAL